MRAGAVGNPFGAALGEADRAQIAGILDNPNGIRRPFADLVRDFRNLDRGIVTRQALRSHPLISLTHAVDPSTLTIAATSFVVVTLGYSWVVLPWLTRRMDTGPIDGFAVTLVGLWMRLLHRPRWVGFEQVREAVDGGASPDSPSSAPTGLIVIANHASGVDPFLLQMPLRRRIRWMMAREQMLRELEEVWEHLEILPVTYGPQDAATFREAMRHVQAGGVLGIFPEGGIARPPQEIRPFLAGVGLIVARAKVPVVVCWIEGAPDASSALGSLFVPSQVTVHCLGMFDFRGQRDVEGIVTTLRETIAKASGWPLNDEPLPWTSAAGAGREPRVPSAT